MKIGAVPYMNGKPLIHGLENEAGIELVTNIPSKLVNMLEKGEIAAGLVSTAACFTHPDLQITPGISISCDGPAESVRLFYKKEIHRIRKVALDTSSLTSVILARMVLHERYSILPQYVPARPALSKMLQECDAAVMIGDPAMQAAAESELPSLDLGSEWHALTGLPFVFAIWAYNPYIAAPELEEILHRAKESGLDSLNTISEMESLRLGLPYETCFHYLSETMSYDLTKRHLEGLSMFSKGIQEIRLENHE